MLQSRHFDAKAQSAGTGSSRLNKSLADILSMAPGWGTTRVRLPL